MKLRCYVCDVLVVDESVLFWLGVELIEVMQRWKCAEKFAVVV